MLCLGIKMTKMLVSAEAQALPSGTLGSQLSYLHVVFLQGNAAENVPRSSNCCCIFLGPFWALVTF